MSKRRFPLWAAGSMVVLAGVCLGQAVTFEVNQTVEVREGDTWSKAKVTEKEGRRYHIQYDGGTEQEWVTADRLRNVGAGSTGVKADKPVAKPAVAPAAGAGDAGNEPGSTGGESGESDASAPTWTLAQEVEAKRGTAWQAATVTKRENGWIQVLYTKGNFYEWVEPWRLRGRDAKEDGIGIAPMHREVAASDPAPKEAPAADTGASGWREPKVGDRVEVIYFGRWVRGRVLEKDASRARVSIDERRNAAGEWHDLRDMHPVGQKLEVKVGQRVQLFDGRWIMGTVVERDTDRARIKKDGWENDMFDKWADLGELRPAPANDVPPISAKGKGSLERTAGYREADVRSARELSLVVGHSGWKFAPDSYGTSTSQPAAKADAPAGARAAVVKGATGKATPGVIVASRGGVGAGASAALVQCREVNGEQIWLDRIDLSTGQTLGAFTLPMPRETQLVDVNSEGTRGLFRTSAGENSRIEVYAFDEAQPKRVSLLFPYGKSDGFNRDIDFAAFVGKEYAITGGGKGELYLWNLTQGRAIYHCGYKRNSQVGISANGKYLALSTGKDALILDALTGNAVAELPPSLAGAVSFAFSPSGKQLVACDASTVWAVDLTSGELYREFTVPGSTANTTIASPGDGYAMINQSVLVDLERRSPIWKYEVPVNSVARVLPSGQYAFAVDSKEQSACNLVVATVPHAAALKAAQASGDDEVLLIRPGSKVSLRTSLGMAGAEEAKIIESVKADLQEAQIGVGENDPVQLWLSIEAGPSEQREYTTHGGMGPFGTRDKVTFTPKVSRVRIVYGGRTLWEVSVTTGTPGMIMMTKAGQSMQQSVDEMSKPNTALFTQTRLPRYLVRPRNPMYFGASELSPRGMRDKRAEPEVTPAPTPTPTTPANPSANRKGPMV